MKKTLFILLILCSLFSNAQLRQIDWKTNVSNLLQLTDSTYVFDAEPYDYNDIGAINREIGNYFIDFVANRYMIISSTSTTITVLDEYRKNVGPQTDQVGRVYQSVGNGIAEYIGGVDITSVDYLSRWKAVAADNELMYRYAVDSTRGEWTVKTSILDTTYIPTGLEQKGATYWDNDNNTASTVMGNGVIYQWAKEAYIDGQNDTGVEIPNGTPVMYAGSIGNSGNFRIEPGIASSTVPAFLFIGVTTEPIQDGEVGKITTRGKAREIQTDGGNYGEVWSAGDIVYESGTTNGYLTNIAPQAPIPAIPVALVISAHATNGTLEVRPTYPQRITESPDVNGTPLDSTGQLLVWNNDFSYFDFDYNINDYFITEEDILPASQVSIAIGGGSPIVTQLQLYIDNIGSSGFFLGGELSDGGAGTLDIAAGSGFIRTTNDENAELQSFKWSALSGIAVTDNTTQYVYIDDSGVITLSTDEFLEAPDKIQIGVVTKEGGVIDHVFSLGVRLQESIGNAGRFIRRVHGISRDKRKGGLIFGQSEDANRYVSMTQGSLWWGRTEYPIPAFNTSGTDIFNTYSASGLEDATATAWPNLQYDNAGTLTNLGNNKWANLFFFIEPDGHIDMVYGRAQFNSEAIADFEGVPSTSLPSRISETSILAARFTFKKSSNIATISSAFEQLFANAGVTSHPDLAVLDFASSGHTGFASSDTTDALRTDINQNTNDITLLDSEAVKSVNSISPTAGNIDIGLSNLNDYSTTNSATFGGVTSTTTGYNDFTGKIRLRGNAIQTFLMLPSSAPVSTNRAFEITNEIGVQKYAILWNGSVQSKGTGLFDGTVTHAAPALSTESALLSDVQALGSSLTLDDVTTNGNETDNDIIIGTSSSSVGAFTVEKIYTTLNKHSFDDYSTLNSSDGLGFGVFDASTTNISTTSINHLMGFQSRLTHNSSGNIIGTDGMAGFMVSNTINGAGVVTNNYGLKIYDVWGTGDITNNYAIYIHNITRGTNDYSIYSVGGANYFGGYINTAGGMNITAPVNSAIKQNTGWLWTDTGLNGGTVRGGIYATLSEELNLFGGSVIGGQVVINSSGDLGVGKSPTNRLSVFQTSYDQSVASSGQFKISESSDVFAGHIGYDQSGFTQFVFDNSYGGNPASKYSFRFANSEVFEILQSGDATFTGTTTGDEAVLDINFQQWGKIKTTISDSLGTIDLQAVLNNGNTATIGAVFGGTVSGDNPILNQDFVTKVYFNTNLPVELWTEDTYGITYADNVGIGKASTSANSLDVSGNTKTTTLDVFGDASVGSDLFVGGRIDVESSGLTPSPPFSYSGSIWMSNADNKLYFTNFTTTYDLTASGGEWDTDANGINYQSGNVGIGITSSSAIGLYVSDASSYASIYGNNTSTTGNTIGVYGKTVSTGAAIAIGGDTYNGGLYSTAVLGSNHSVTTSEHYGGEFRAEFGSLGYGVLGAGSKADFYAKGTGIFTFAEIANPEVSPNSGLSTLQVGTDNFLYVGSELNTIVAGSGLPIEIFTTDPSLVNKDHSIIINASTTNKIFLPSTNIIGNIFVIVNRIATSQTFRNNGDTANISINTINGGTTQTIAGNTSMTIQWVSSTWYQIQ